MTNPFRFMTKKEFRLYKSEDEMEKVELYKALNEMLSPDNKQLFLQIYLVWSKLGEKFWSKTYDKDKPFICTTLYCKRALIASINDVVGHLFIIQVSDDSHVLKDINHDQWEYYKFSYAIPLKTHPISFEERFSELDI